MKESRAKRTIKEGFEGYGFSFEDYFDNFAEEINSETQEYTRRWFTLDEFEDFCCKMAKSITQTCNNAMYKNSISNKGLFADTNNNYKEIGELFFGSGGVGGIFVTMDEERIRSRAKDFLDTMIEKGKIEEKNGKYRIKKRLDTYHAHYDKDITKENKNMKRTIKEYVKPTAFEDKALFDDFKDSIGGRCFNKDSVYRWVYKLTDIKPTDDEIYEIMDKWVKNKWAYKKENERTGANFYYFDLKETVSEGRKNMKRTIKENNMDKRSEIIDFLKSADENVIEAIYDALREELNKKDYIILTKEIKQKYPRLKNISMIEAKSEYRNWEESMKYAENLYKGGYNDWRIPTCSGDKRVNDSTDEIYALYEAKEDLHKLAVEQGVEDDFLKSGNYWSNQENENNADYILCVTSDGSIANGIKDFSELSCRCVR